MCRHGGNTPTIPTTESRPAQINEPNTLVINACTHARTQSSACSTFNILNQEDRRVVGALLAVDEEEPPAGGAAP